MENKHKKLCMIAILIAFMAFVTASSISVINGINGTNGSSLIGSTLTLFLHNDTATDIIGYNSKKMNRTFNISSPLAYSNKSSIANGNTLLQNWTSDSLGLNLIPRGVHTLHIHALKVGGGAHVDKLFYSCGFVNSTGGNLSIRGTSELSQEILTTMTEIDIDMLMPDEHTNLTDKMIIEVYVNQTGTGVLPEIQLQFDDLTDSRLIFPTTQVDLTQMQTDINTKINKTGDTVEDSFCLTVNGSTSQFCIGSAGFSYFSSITNNVLSFNGGFGLENNFSQYLFSDNNDTIIYSANGLNMTGKNITDCANCGDGYFRDLFAGQGKVVAGTWAWSPSASQTDFENVQGNTAGFWHSLGANNEEYKYNSYLSTGQYIINVSHIKNVDEGIAEVLLYSTSLGTKDMYHNPATFNNVWTIGFNITTQGRYDIRFKATGKNASSANYVVNFARFQIEKVGEI